MRGEGLSALSPSVNMRAITSAAVIYITHKSHEPIKYGFGGGQKFVLAAAKNFSMQEKPWYVLKRVVRYSNVVPVLFFSGDSCVIKRLWFVCLQEVSDIILHRCQYVVMR